MLLVLEPALHALPWENTPMLQHHHVYRVLSMGASLEAAARWASTDIDSRQAYYLLNPSGDLAATQAAFADWFAEQGWSGHAGHPPSPDWLPALQRSQLFVYFGHGAGERYLPNSVLRRLRRCPAALLMGCSSARLRGEGGYAPSGPVLSYNQAGAPVAVANLWDVTDGDIDRFSRRLLGRWVGGGERDVAASVGGSREACRLRWLIGAAPVCYGLPSAVKPS